MMGRSKKHDRHLPARMRFKHGAYYRVVRDRWTPLGKHFGAALKQWAALEASPPVVTTVGQALDAYLMDELPQLADATQVEYRRMSAQLREVFGDTPLDEVEATHIAQYLHKRSARVQANREMALLSSVFAYAMRLGFAKANPCRGVRRNKEARRTRLPTGPELAALLLAASPTLRAMIELSLMTGMRKRDLLKLAIADLSPRGIEVCTSKTATPVCFTWDVALRALVDGVKGSRQIGPLFITRRARGWTSSGLDSVWDRLRAKVGITALHWHDLRAWALTMADRTRGREYARLLAAHQDAATTDIYLRDRSAREVAPLNTRQLLEYETAPSAERS